MSHAHRVRYWSLSSLLGLSLVLLGCGAGGGGTSIPAYTPIVDDEPEYPGPQPIPGVPLPYPTPPRPDPDPVRVPVASPAGRGPGVRYGDYTVSSAETARRADWLVIGKDPRAEEVAERQGFEPWVPLRVHRFSNSAF